MLQCPVGKAEDVAGLAEWREAMSIETLPALRPTRAPWNKGRIVGQKRPLLPKHVWSIRVRLEMADNKRDLALFNMAIDCKLRGCDLVGLKVNDVYAAGRVKERASVTQSKTRKPVRFEITETTRLSGLCSDCSAGPASGRPLTAASSLWISRSRQASISDFGRSVRRYPAQEIGACDPWRQQGRGRRAGGL